MHHTVDHCKYCSNVMDCAWNQETLFHTLLAITVPLCSIVIPTAAELMHGGRD